MPLLKIVTNVQPTPAVRSRLLSDLSKLVATRLGKPESYVMTCFDGQAAMTFGGSSESTCLVELKSVGRFTSDVTRSLSVELCEFIESALAIPKARVYIEFADVAGHLWGHSAGNFG
ncbi:MAG TPA: phenylpyruvate tautomerase MIF-related protein [Polyangiaceae bacterium]|jgi:phenylpyruvate tautomerase PptA (4-oxalocrotonate tautomerase family)|nr:phenylpyruvate tautomerase MIF-related protein [Polyangiaceae bacterium]